MNASGDAYLASSLYLPNTMSHRSNSSVVTEGQEYAIEALRDELEQLTVENTELEARLAQITKEGRADTLRNALADSPVLAGRSLAEIVEFLETLSDSIEPSSDASPVIDPELHSILDDHV
ncbi:uncharacterized protein AMSG_07720 [Thecamonas trahens ATCC 50062]|uniref:Uncharacterized protein n=1 Tax=Thecamonas trahens ATCC 50062 TaxID=461836 RepID=A0A0L0DH69_THETB|nr:hypothetical protein AMSG_07720 [Thecamonas trahens ATCC 50062]KNC51657.1 hypothetical protein AMSG_07720 [Thecamonas trahens ATCC 50062]|eukprot:XP_013755795.1 hypothetical protein AMSG_07720 [Thecamonas trahens ATCC 50062]